MRDGLDCLVGEDVSLVEKAVKEAVTKAGLNKKSEMFENGIKKTNIFM